MCVEGLSYVMDRFLFGKGNVWVQQCNLRLAVSPLPSHHPLVTTVAS
jgi:hypothetical protein